MVSQNGGSAQVGRLRPGRQAERRLEIVAESRVQQRMLGMASMLGLGSVRKCVCVSARASAEAGWR